MPDETRKQVVEIITRVWDRDTQIDDAADEIIDIVTASLGDVEKMRAALEWYSTQAKRMGNAAIQQDSRAILVLMKEVAVDYGGRAREALATGGGNASR